MWQLLADGREPEQRWKQRLESGRTYVVGRGASVDLPVPWEPLLSRRHFLISGSDGEFHVQRCPEAVNPIYFQGEPCSEFHLVPGQKFVVGETSFAIREQGSLSPRDDAPIEEVAFSNVELAQVQFEDADRRLDALSRLPSVIGEWIDSEEKGAALAGLILAGIRHAEVAAVVNLAGDEEVGIIAWDRRTETQGSFRPSLGLVRDALRERRSILHVWEQADTGNHEYTLSAEFDWAFCTPLSRAGGERTGIYVAGRFAQIWNESRQLQLALRADIRFTQLVAEVVSSSERMNRMEGQLSVLRQFLSPPLLSALEETGRNGELNVDLLQPRVCDVTVLFCDLRGFSHFAEEAIDDLEGFLSKVNAALEVMTDAILSHGGVTGDFLGDAVLGFWGWPFASEDAPVRACRAALAIRREFARLHGDRTSPLCDFRVGVGVARGRAVAGKIGTGGRVSVTVFGPVVNLASRLEGMTKKLRVPLVIDEATAQVARERLPADEGRVRKLATVRPYGLETPLTVSELIPPFGDHSDLTDEHLALFERGVDQFAQGNWEQAYRALHGVPSSDQAQDFLLALITQHNRQAPPDWQGIVDLIGK